MAEPIEGRSRELLDAPNFYYVATVRRDGTPHVVPVWFVLEGDDLLITTGPKSVKGRAVLPRGGVADGRRAGFSVREFRLALF